MLVATGTMEDENGDNLSVDSRVLARTGDWIPASAGMTEWWWNTGYFQRNHPCRLAVCTPRDENGESWLAEEFDRQWRFEPVEESVACGPSGTPSCCRSTMSEHAYQLEYMWGRPLPAISDGGKRNASVIRTMCGVGCP